MVMKQILLRWLLPWKAQGRPNAIMLFSENGPEILNPVFMESNKTSDHVGLFTF